MIKDYLAHEPEMVHKGIDKIPEEPKRTSFLIEYKDGKEIRTNILPNFSENVKKVYHIIYKPGTTRDIRDIYDITEAWKEKMLNITK